MRWCPIFASFFLREYVWNIFNFPALKLQLNNVLCPCLIPLVSPQLCVLKKRKKRNFFPYFFNHPHVVDSHAEVEEKNEMLFNSQIFYYFNGETFT